MINSQCFAEMGASSPPGVKTIDKRMGLGRFLEVASPQSHHLHNNTYFHEFHCGLHNFMKMGEITEIHIILHFEVKGTSRNPPKTLLIPRLFTPWGGGGGRFTKKLSL